MNFAKHVHLRLFLLAVVPVFTDVENAVADTGEPVAIRCSDGCFVIESMWNLAVQIVDEEQFRSVGGDGIDLIRCAESKPTLPNRIRQAVPPATSLDFTLDRPANKTSVGWEESSSAKPTTNAIRIRSEGPVISIEVDGVRIAYVDDMSPVSSPSREWVKDADVLLIGDAGEVDDDSFGKETNAKRIVVRDDAENGDSTANTVVVNSKGLEDLDSSKVVRLNSKPLTLGEELEGLLIAKEVACRDSQKVFSELSTNQMNFRPSNGSHTPRWNTEHMMGRELLFFSQIFHAIDPMIPVMDLNPKQMPPDYQAKHSDWDGKEEARQMERVTAFTNRFAYLLRDLPLDARAPGSRWTLRGLLRQMDRHYSEHTANVVKKFDLPDWPSE